MAIFNVCYSQSYTSGNFNECLVHSFLSTCVPLYFFYPLSLRILSFKTSFCHNIVAALHCFSVVWYTFVCIISMKWLFQSLQNNKQPFSKIKMPPNERWSCAQKCTSQIYNRTSHTNTEKMLPKRMKCENFNYYW